MFIANFICNLLLFKTIKLELLADYQLLSTYSVQIKLFMKTMPAVFVGHGDPMIAIDDNNNTHKLNEI